MPARRGDQRRSGSRKSSSRKGASRKSGSRKKVARTPRARALTTVEANRFASGWRLLQDTTSDTAPRSAAADEIRFDLVRPLDLVALSVTAIGCDLIVGGAAAAHLKARHGENARLTVTHAFQHGFEQAIYETQATVPDHEGKPVADGMNADGPGEPHTPPVGFRPARASRLVFRIPDDEAIEFSTSGILAAMGRLELAVHPLAQPGDAPTTGSISPPPLIILPLPFIHLGDGLVARLHANGTVIERATAAFLREHPAPDTSTLSGIVLQARELRRARAELQHRTATVAPRTHIPVDSIFAPGAGIIAEIPERIRPPRTLSRPPTIDETAIEAPFRLVISPSAEARWAHATEPVSADDESRFVELWHSRLASAPTMGGQPDEHNRKRRIVRAIWARDRDTVGDAWKDKSLDHDLTAPLSHADPRVAANYVDPPFLGSLDRFDRHMLVRQSAETWPGKTGPIAPVPIAADALWLSGLGAWLELHGAWTTKPYSEVDMQSILSWDHIAPLGRDQYVRVVYPGYLYPFGHQAALVKVTERKMKKEAQPIAGLYQRMFLVLGERTRAYGQLNFPFISADIRPLVTPILDKPSETEGDSQSKFFWPKVLNERFRFTIDARDHDHRPIRLHTPLMWVAESYGGQDARAAVDSAYAKDQNRKVVTDGQKIAFVPRNEGPDTELESTAVWLLGSAGLGESTPRMSAATVFIPAVQHLSATDAIPIRYFGEYARNGFGSATSGDIWAEVNIGAGGEAPQVDPTTVLPQLQFGAGAPAGSDKAGGFLSPDLPIRGLSRLTGPVGDVSKMVKNEFDPKQFLLGAMPRLFGLVDLADLIPSGTLDQAPSIVTDTLGRIEQFATDVERAVAQAQEAVDEAQKLVERAKGKSSDLQAKANQALQKAQTVAASAQNFATAFTNLFPSLAGLDPIEIENATKSTFTALDTLIADLRTLAALLPPHAATRLLTLADALSKARDAEGVIDDLYNFVNGFDPTSLEASFRFDWKPQLQEWPKGKPILELGNGGKDNLVLSVEGRVSGKGEMGVTASAEIRDFSLLLFPGAPLMRVPFDHMYFRSGTEGKPDVNVVLGDIEFLGLLSFVEVIKDLISFDGFSDPPFLEVSKEGATAGFTLALPSVAIGVFNLSNMSLGADVRVPFLGKTVTVGFNFCTRERPFTLTVMALGGGGWFCIRVAPDGLDVLELGLEAGACLAVDFGVASGSISAMVGIYIRLEGEKGSLTGYFRLRGEVDVLGLISASIELYMELIYEFDTGKMTGRATITVSVKVLLFSGTVKISAERRLAGSNGDPSLKEILGAESGTSPAWSEYCLAFAGE
jgi:hypothetical protein